MTFIYIATDGTHRGYALRDEQLGWNRLRGLIGAQLIDRILLADGRVLVLNQLAEEEGREENVYVQRDLEGVWRGRAFGDAAIVTDTALSHMARPYVEDGGAGPDRPARDDGPLPDVPREVRDVRPRRDGDELVGPATGETGAVRPNGLRLALQLCEERLGGARCHQPAVLLLDIGLLTNRWLCEECFHELIGDRARIVRDLRSEGD